MIIKTQIKRGAIQKVCHLHNDIFHHIQLCQTLSILLYDFSCVSHSASLRNYRMKEKEIFCIVAASAQHVLLREVEITPLDKIVFLDTRVSINNPH